MGEKETMTAAGMEQAGLTQTEGRSSSFEKQHGQRVGAIGPDMEPDTGKSFTSDPYAEDSQRVATGDVSGDGVPDLRSAGMTQEQARQSHHEKWRAE